MSLEESERTQGPARPAPGSSLGRFLALGAVVQLATIAASLVRSKALALTVGPEGIGVMAETMQLVTVGTIAVGVASAPPVTGALARAAKARSVEDARQALAMALLLGAVLAGLGGGCAVLVAPYVLPSTHWSIDARWATALTAAGTLASTLAAVIAASMGALGDLRGTTLYALISVLLGSALTVGLTIAWGLHGAFLSMLAAGACGLVVAVALLRRRDAPMPLPLSFHWDWSFARQCFIIGGAAVGGSYVEQLKYVGIRATLQAIGAGELGTFYNGQFQAAQGLELQFFTMLMGGLLTYHWPQFATAKTDRDLNDMVRATGDFVLRVVPPVTFLAIALRHEAMRIAFSSRFDMATSILGYYLGALVLRTMLYTLCAPLLFRNRAVPFALLSIVGWTGQAAISVAAIRLFGPLGVGPAAIAGWGFHFCACILVIHLACHVSLRPGQLLQIVAYTAAAVVFQVVGERWSWVRWVCAPVIAVWVWRAGVNNLIMRRFGRSTKVPA